MLDLWIKISIAILLGSAVFALLSMLIFRVINHYQGKAMKKKVDEGLRKIRKKEKDDGLV